MAKAAAGGCPRLTDLHLLPGLGPKSVEWLREVGIEAELRSAGAGAAYCRVKHWNPRLASRNLLYALHAALDTMHWRAVDADTKARLRAEAVVAEKPKKLTGSA